MSRAGWVPHTNGSPPTLSPQPVPPRPSSGYDYDRDDPGFLAALRASRPAVEHVKRFLTRLGYSATVHEIHERPSPKLMHAFRDRGDITVTGSGERIRVEVRQLMWRWSGVDEYRRRYSTFLISQCNQIDNVHPPVDLYFYVSEDMRSGAMLDVPATRPYWRRQTRWHGPGHRFREFYDCDFAHVCFFAFGGDGGER